MFRHYLKIAVRNIVKYKTQNIIVVLSIALGMVFSSLTFMWIRHERSYDSFYSNADEIYLVMRKDSKYEGEKGSSYTSYPEGTYLSDKYPQIEFFARCQQDGKYSVSRKSNVIAELTGMSIDANFRDFFDVQVLEGDKNLNLAANEAALTKTQADLLFEGGNAVGEMLETDKGMFSIKAVIEDPRTPTSLPYDFLTGYDLERYNRTGIKNSRLFFRVNGSNVQQLADKIACDTLIETYDNFRITYISNYNLIPLSKVREEGALQDSVVKLNVKLHYVYILMLLGLVLIVCSLTNYFTLFVTKMRMRVKEISLRYANGACMSQIVMLFCTEIVLMLAISLLAGAVICIFTLPYFTELSVMNKPFLSLVLSYLLYAAAIGVISVLIALLFITMTGRKQLARYFGKSMNKPVTAIGYKISIGFQLAVSICAIFCSVIISRQINHLLQSADMGYRKHNLGTCYQFGMSESDVAAAREKLKSLPELDKVVYGFLPTNSYRRYSSVYTDTAGFRRENLINVVPIQANRDYLDLIDVKLVAGELFSDEETGNSVIINETLANLFGGAGQIVGKQIFLLRGPATVKGVIKDVCYFDPKTVAEPLLYDFQKEGNVSGVNQPNTFLFSYKEGIRFSELEKKILAIMTEIKPVATYSIVNMETDYLEYIKSELMLGKLLKIITFLCIIIAISGLYSIVALLCQKRRKEIAVRKINGAKMNDILRMFLKEYTPIILASTMVAFVVGLVLMHRWLSNYVRHTPITIWIFISVFLSMLLIVALTVFGNIRRAMVENPADVIKSE